MAGSRFTILIKTVSVRFHAFSALFKFLQLFSTCYANLMGFETHCCDARLTAVA